MHLHYNNGKQEICDVQAIYELFTSALNSVVWRRDLQIINYFLSELTAYKKKLVSNLRPIVLAKAV